MSRSKKKQRQAQARAQAAQRPAGSGTLAKWLPVLVVAAIGLPLLLYMSGVFDRPPESTSLSDVADRLPPGDTAPDDTVPPDAEPAGADSALIPTVGWRDWSEIDDPASDGWQTEVLHEKVKKQLKALGKLLTHPADATSDALAPLLAADFECGPLRPGEMRTWYRENGVVVQRGTFDESIGAHRGAAGLAAAIAELCQPLRDASDARFEFKVTRVEPAEDSDDIVQTEQFLALSGRTAAGMVEQHVTWVTDWAVDSNGADDAPPRLRTLRATSFEETQTRRASGPLFADCTKSVLGKNASYEDQILRGLNHWLTRKPYRNLLSMLNTPGIAVADVNGDGLEDLFLCQEAAIPNRLYLQQPDGSARDVSAEWGVDWINDTRSVLLIDLDNDGDQDLVVAVPSNLVLAENENNERFRIRATLPVSEDPTSLSAFDYDLDGRLDIYVCAYQPDRLLISTAASSVGVAGAETIFHDANDAAANSMFHNETTPGQPWKFVDVTKEVGLDTANRRWSLAAASEDYDNDGDGDLYVANDYGRDNIFRNDVTEDGRHVFVEVGQQARAEQAANGMGITWSDYDLDGWIDAYVSNMWSSAGHRIAGKPQFMPHADDATRKWMQHFAVGNTLLRNRGDGVFEDRSIAEGVNRGRWAWGSQFLDVNNDGWDDLVVANGYITADDTGDL